MIAQNLDPYFRILIDCPEIRLVWEGLNRGSWVEPPRRLFDTELVWCEDGAFELTAAARTWNLLPGSVALIPPGVLHESRLAGSPSALRRCVHFAWGASRRPVSPPFWAWSWEEFDASRIEPAPAGVRELLPLVLGPDSGGDAACLAREFFAAVRSKNSSAPFRLTALLQALLHGQHSHDRPSTSENGRAIATVMQLRHHLEERFADPISLDSLAGLARWNRSYLCATFNEVIGLPPMAYLTRIRMEHAHRLLREGRVRLNVAEVAERVGIGDPNYFSRLFRRHFGRSPSDVARQA